MSGVVEILIDEVERQFHADGIGAEQSPTYTAFTLELYLTAASVAERRGNPLPSAVINRLAVVGDALSWFMDENGQVPRIGDDDEGRVIVSDLQADRLYVASILQATAAICKRAYLAPPVAPAHLRDLVFRRSEAKISRQARGTGARNFPDGGYTVLRERINEKRVVLIMDHAPLGYLSIAAHGHADTLSVWLSYGGKSLLGDAGTYLYHSGGAWRDAFRGTQLHNTLSIGGQSSSLVSGAFNWKAKADVHDVDVDCHLDSFRCQATHDGYLARFGVKHGRILKRISSDTFTIEDRLDGPCRSELPVMIGFVAGDGIEIVEADCSGSFNFVADGAVLMRLTGPQGLSARICRAVEDRKLGWLSHSFGRKQPASHLVFEGIVSPSSSMMTQLKLL
ncbi:heparinase II/III-family protein (plasmid) [Aliirhizobium terrae]|uniref:alginate lyase family protein n=1 Tax=Terrirhizobium terrae TaxID=2926709 RepID=UPI0025780085|nr:alginate lyase family protein [Rhizobium sp. CC-CFT758]WJH37652.1 heparinase II/III-family protein [Rhizobium sp. CC-CFT758]